MVNATIIIIADTQLYDKVFSKDRRIALQHDFGKLNGLLEQMEIEIQHRKVDIHNDKIHLNYECITKKGHKYVSWVLEKIKGPGKTFEKQPIQLTNRCMQKQVQQTIAKKGFLYNTCETLPLKCFSTLYH